MRCGFDRAGHQPLGIYTVSLRPSGFCLVAISPPCLQLSRQLPGLWGVCSDLDMFVVIYFRGSRFYLLLRWAFDAFTRESLYAC